MAGMAITRIMPATMDENAGRSMTRPRRASNQLTRPRMANAIGVLANAIRAAVRAATSRGSSASSLPYFAHRPATFIVPPPSVQEEGNLAGALRPQESGPRERIGKEGQGRPSRFRRSFSPSRENRTRDQLLTGHGRIIAEHRSGGQWREYKSPTCPRDRRDE